ncbi:MAG TPA: substrate-binding domain-containing protein [Candidatus Competibacter sp.]|nr:substrate-binding domain-containing protein [Candidatus Competibacter sp.]
MQFIALKRGIGTIVLGLAFVAGVASPWASTYAETVTAGGTGSAAPLIEQFARSYQNRRPEVAIQVISPPMGSNASIRAALAGAIDLAFPGKPLTAEEKTKGGQDWELGRTPFLVVTSKTPPPSGFTVEQLAAIYSGKVTVWADGSPIRLVLRSPMESDTLILRKLSPEMDRAIDAALARSGMLVAANDLENVDLLEKTTGSLGTTNLALLQSQHRGLHALAIDGAAPTAAALAQGTYSYSKPLYVVRGPTLSPTAQDFLEFVLSASSQEVFERAGYVTTSRRP